MAEGNVEIIRDQYAAVNERDWARAMGHYAEDVELHAQPGGIRGGVFRRRKAVREWFGDWFSTFDRDAHFDMQEIAEVGDDGVLVIAAHRARGRGSGVAVEGILVWLYQLRDGKITRVEGFDTPEEGREAAGLSS
jgi:ketosteroid isomerase-like protein